MLIFPRISNPKTNVWDVGRSRQAKERGESAVDASRFQRLSGRLPTPAAGAELVADFEK
jgi:hypothetical protein